jgi:hypothetical protein
MAKVEIGARLSLDAKDSLQNVGNIKKALREANQELLHAQDNFGEFSSEAIQAARKVADLKDKIGDAKSLVDAFNPDRKFVAFAQSVQGVTGGFAALQGVMGLMGVESENVQKQLLKVQSALALTQGLDNIRESAQGMKNLANIVGNTLTKAFSTLKGAIISTGIGALIVGVGVLIANFDSLKESIFGVDRAAKSAADNAERAAIAEHDKFEALQLSENSLRLQGKSEAEILKLKIQQTNEEITRREQQLQASIELERSQVEAAKRNHDILKGIIDFISKPIRFVLETAAKVSDFLGITDNALEKIKKTTEETNNQIANFLFDPEEVQAEGDAALKELRTQIAKLKSERDGFKLSLNKEAGKNSDPEFDRLKNLNLDPETDPAVLADRAQKDALLANANIFTQGLINADTLRTGIEIGNMKQRALTAQQEAEARISAAYAVGDALGAISNLIGQQTAVGKALGIAQATINMWVGVTEVLRNKTTIPEPFGTIQKIASIATIIASGTNAIKNLTKVKVPGAGGGASGAGAGSAGSSAPLTPALSTQRTSLDQNTINNIGNQAIKAFVVETDVTTNQETVKRLNRAARI